MLLIGGGLTFARWYDEASLGNQAAEVKSGELSFAIDNLACQWANGGDNVAPGDLIGLFAAESVVGLGASVAG